MNNVFGPYNKSQWETLLYLRYSINWMKEKDRIKYGPAIDKEKNWFKELAYAGSRQECEQGQLLVA